MVETSEDSNKAEVSGRDSSIRISSTKKKIFIASFIVMLVGGLGYQFFFSSSKKSQTKHVHKMQQIAKIQAESRQVVQDNTPEIKLPPKLPALPPLKPPKLPEIKTLPPINEPILNKLPAPPQLPQVNPTQLKQVIKAMPSAPSFTTRKTNINTPMIAFSSGDNQIDTSSLKDIDLSNPANLMKGNTLERLRKALRPQEKTIDENSPLKHTSAEQAVATYVGNLKLILAQGKIIDAVLETAINTDIKGMLRAIVSRDVLSDSGSNILIPKGSRIIGSYGARIRGLQSRVDIVWQRIIRPDGIDIAVDSPGTDMRGRSGIGGEVDNKFTSMLMNAFLLTTIRIGSGLAVSKILPSEKISVTQNNKGEKTTTGSAAAMLAQQASQDLQSTAQEILNKFKDVQPTIEVKQGTRIKVFVQKDLIFPKETLATTRVIQ